MAASQLTLLQTTVALPAGPFQLACFVAVAGAIGLSASALFAIRAAILGFAIGLAAVISWLSGPSVATPLAPGLIARSEERSAGKQCLSTRRSRWSPHHLTKTNED